MSDANAPFTGEWLRFGDFALSPHARELRRGGRLIAVGGRAMEILLTLVLHAGQPVAKARLMTAAWGGRLVEHSNLTVQITTLRRLLRADTDAADAQGLIRTLPGTGYMFVAAVERERTLPTDDGRRSLTTPASAARTGAAGPPEPLTLFIGRDNERAALKQLLRCHRAVSLVGIGGVGKTRLALRLRSEVAPAYPDGVTFVDLAPLEGPEQLVDTVAASAGAGSGGFSAEAAIVASLHTGRQLLILDNTEHLTAAVRELLRTVLTQCPGLSALVTSRESLGLPGEAIFRLSPMELPPPELSLTAAEALRFEAIRLFANRAEALLPGFVLDDGNVGRIADVCRRLDGIALAIEMAVPRLEILSPAQLADRLHDRFRAVTGLRHDALPRQRTLRAMFDWSWELLLPPERGLLKRLATFATGATLEDLEALAGPRERRDETLDHLTVLSQKSLVAVNPPTVAGAEPRYRLLETTRQYALEQLSPDESADLARRFALRMADRFERADAEWAKTHSATWLACYGPDADNLRLAMRWAFDMPCESQLAMRLVAASFSLWWELPGLPLRESRRWHDLAVARISADTPAAIQARLWLGRSWTDTVDGDTENFPSAILAAQLFSQDGDRVGQAAALWRAASAVFYRDHQPASADLLQQATRLLEGRAAIKWETLCRIRQADLLQFDGHLVPALAEYDRALAMARRMGHAYGLMVAGGNRSYLLYNMGQREEAIAALRALHGELPVGLSRPLISQLAILLAAAGYWDEAREAVLDSLTGTLSIGMLATLGRSLEALALVLAKSGASGFAARLLGFVLKLHPADRVRLGPRRAVYVHLIATLEATLGIAERAALMTNGASWSDAEATEAAIDMCSDPKTGRTSYVPTLSATALGPQLRLPCTQEH